MTREWKVGDHLRAGERKGIVVEVIHNGLIVDFAGERWTWILPSPALVYVEQEQSEEARIFPHTKVEVGGETVLDTTAKRSRTIRASEYLIYDPKEAIDCGFNLRVWLAIDEAGKLVLRVERLRGTSTLELDFEELELLLEVAKKLLQKE